MADQGITSPTNDSQLWTAHILGITKDKPEGNIVVSKVATLPDVDTDIDDSRRDELLIGLKQDLGLIVLLKLEHGVLMGQKRQLLEL